MAHGNRYTTPAPCGTRAAYQRHQRNNEEIDDACREAWNTSQREIIYAEGSKNLEHRRMTNRAAGKANTDMKHMYPIEWEMFYQKRLKEEEDAQGSEE